MVSNYRQLLKNIFLCERNWSIEDWGSYVVR